MVNISEFLMLLNVNDFVLLIKPLFFVVIGLCLYSLYVFHFYAALSKKDIFPLNLRKHSKRLGEKLENLYSMFLYVIEYLLIFPLFTLFWFAILSLFLIFLSSNNVSHILLLSMGLIATIRISSYYNEELSRDLAKLVPFALLAVFLTNISQFSLANSMTTILNIGVFWKEIIYYFIFVVIIEFVMRVASGLFNLGKKEE